MRGTRRPIRVSSSWVFVPAAAATSSIGSAAPSALPQSTAPAPPSQGARPPPQRPGAVARVVPRDDVAGPPQPPPHRVEARELLLGERVVALVGAREVGVQALEPDARVVGQLRRACLHLG